MNAEDKTGDKLVASIRKTKAGVGNAAGDTETKPAPAPRRRSAAKPKPAAPKRDDAPGSVTPGYQSPGRVWPD
jgi:hypothetical protein